MPDHPTFDDAALRADLIASLVQRARDMAAASGGEITPSEALALLADSLRADLPPHAEYGVLAPEVPDA